MEGARKTWPDNRENSTDPGEVQGGRDWKNKAVKKQMLIGSHTREKRPYKKQKQSKCRDGERELNEVKTKC